MEENENLKSLVKQSYDEIAQHYLDWSAEHESPRASQIQNLLAKITNPADAPVLELGCGAGIPGTDLLSRKFRSVVANDISDAQIDLAKKNISPKNVQFIAGDMMKLTFEPSHFDAVVAFYSVIHLPKEEQLEIFKQICSWLKPGGFLLCNLGTTENPGGTKPWLGGAQMYWSGFDADQYQTLLTERGFSLINTEIISDNEDGRMVPFLWILAQKT
ncbi:hypothetical protein LTR84_001711 [Exophiala bonariae]|uniref:Methyltransferase domain-containing protein n=1 Tax=Exophiala bonariae TaxID=1690606 RepID=A0AAV9NC91_9EURO|nr:hypothetical protein LTR84_001711 [Exophiala bonariae]